MDRNKLLLFMGLGGHFTAVIFTQMAYWKYGYPNPFWQEINPVLHSAFLLGKPWFHWIYAAAMTGFILAPYFGAKSKIFYVRAFVKPWFYAFSLAYLFDGINDVCAYFFLQSLPFSWVPAIILPRTMFFSSFSMILITCFSVQPESSKLDSSTVIS